MARADDNIDEFENNITIPTYVFEGLEADSRMLHALYSAGLTDGTYFYDRAIEILEEDSA